MNLKCNCIRTFNDLKYGETFIADSATFPICYIKVNAGSSMANAVNLINGDCVYFNPSLLVIPVTIKSTIQE